MTTTAKIFIKGDNKPVYVHRDGNHVGDQLERLVLDHGVDKVIETLEDNQPNGFDFFSSRATENITEDTPQWLVPSSEEFTPVGGFGIAYVDSVNRTDVTDYTWEIDPETGEVNQL